MSTKDIGSIVSERARYAQQSVASALLKALSDPRPIRYVTNDVHIQTSNMVMLFDAVKEGVRMEQLTIKEFPSYAEGVHKALDELKSVVLPEDMVAFDMLEKTAKDRLAAKERSLAAAEKLETQSEKERPNSIAREAGAAVAELSPMKMAAIVLDGVTANVSEASKEALEHAPSAVKEFAQPEVGGSAIEVTKETSASQPAEGSATAIEAGTKEPEKDESETTDHGFPAEISTQYFLQRTQLGTTRVFADAKASREVFQDAGEKLRTKTFEPTAVRLMVDTAAHRGWTSIEIKGSKEFRREAWLEGQARGIIVKGYTPTELDWQEVTRREQAHLKNEIRHVEEKAIAPRSSTQAGVSERPEGDKSKVQSASSASRPVAEVQGQSFRAGVKGILVEHGQRAYQDNPKNEQSYYAVLRTAEGERTVWGVGIPDALYKADAKEGDTITLRESGMEKVKKTVIREVDGIKVKQEAMVDRRSWEADVIERGKSATEATKDRTPEVDASLKSKTVVEEKQATRDGDASTTEPANQQTNRLQQLRQEHEASKGRDEQER